MKKEVQFKGHLNRIAKVDASEIFCSALTRFESARRENPGYAIKYVSSGTERYIVNKRCFEVGSGQYLLLNKSQVYECNFQSEYDVKGFCVTLDESMLASVYNVLSRSEEMLLDDPYRQSASLPGLHEMVYTRGNSLGEYLHELHQLMLTGRMGENAHDVFYGVAVELLKSQADVNGKLTRLNATKLSTRRELFARLEAARQLLEECSDASLKIEDVAQKAALSEFHFYRTFKSVYGISPHQFLLKKKVERAAAMILLGEENLTSIAYMTGFADIYSFSRSFRQLMGVSPSLWKSGIQEKCCN